MSLLDPPIRAPDPLIFKVNLKHEESSSVSPDLASESAARSYDLSKVDNL